jgi:hypothetical protein
MYTVGKSGREQSPYLQPSGATIRVSYQPRAEEGSFPVLKISIKNFTSIYFLLFSKILEGLLNFCYSHSSIKSIFRRHYTTVQVISTCAEFTIISPQISNVNSGYFFSLQLISQFEFTACPSITNSLNTNIDLWKWKGNLTHSKYLNFRHKTRKNPAMKVSVKTKVLWWKVWIHC